MKKDNRYDNEGEFILNKNSGDFSNIEDPGNLYGIDGNLNIKEDYSVFSSDYYGDKLNTFVSAFKNTSPYIAYMQSKRKYSDTKYNRKFEYSEYESMINNQSEDYRKNLLNALPNIFTIGDFLEYDYTQTEFEYNNKVVAESDSFVIPLIAEGLTISNYVAAGVAYKGYKAINYVANSVYKSNKFINTSKVGQSLYKNKEKLKFTESVVLAEEEGRLEEKQRQSFYFQDDKKLQAIAGFTNAGMLLGGRTFMKALSGLNGKQLNDIGEGIIKDQQSLDDSIKFKDMKFKEQVSFLKNKTKEELSSFDNNYINSIKNVVHGLAEKSPTLKKKVEKMFIKDKTKNTNITAKDKQGELEGIYNVTMSSLHIEKNKFNNYGLKEGEEIFEDMVKGNKSNDNNNNLRGVVSDYFKGFSKYGIEEAGYIKETLSGDKTRLINGVEVTDDIFIPLNLKPATLNANKDFSINLLEKSFKSGNDNVIKNINNDSNLTPKEKNKLINEKTLSIKEIEEKAKGLYIKVTAPSVIGSTTKKSSDKLIKREAELDWGILLPIMEKDLHTIVSIYHKKQMPTMSMRSAFGTQDYINDKGIKSTKNDFKLTTDIEFQIKKEFLENNSKDIDGDFKLVRDLYDIALLERQNKKRDADYIDTGVTGLNNLATGSFILKFVGNTIPEMGNMIYSNGLTSIAKEYNLLFNFSSNLKKEGVEAFKNNPNVQLFIKYGFGESDAIIGKTKLESELSVEYNDKFFVDITNSFKNFFTKISKIIPVTENQRLVDAVALTKNWLSGKHIPNKITLDFLGIDEKFIKNISDNYTIKDKNGNPTTNIDKDKISKKDEEKFIIAIKRNVDQDIMKPGDEDVNINQTNPDNALGRSIFHLTKFPSSALNVLLRRGTRQDKARVAISSIYATFIIATIEAMQDEVFYKTGIREKKKYDTSTQEGIADLMLYSLNKVPANAGTGVYIGKPSSLISDSYYDRNPATQIAPSAGVASNFKEAFMNPNVENINKINPFSKQFIVSDLLNEEAKNIDKHKGW